MRHPSPLTGHVVSHTHWDRAWYWTFEQTRLRLLDLMDDLLELMLADPGYRHFTLDGQMAMVQDYLALRPERAPTVRQLAHKGRLLLGPFYVLPDLYIPSGESLVRNLRAGHAAAAPLGPAMKLGYLPDPFGHPAQLPQVLQGFGIEGMLFTRGMGDEGETLGADFLWEAPDGSRVLATHQVGGGYGNAEELGRPPRTSRDPSTPVTAEARARYAVAALERLVAAMAPLCPHGQLLLNNGCDHLPPQPELPEVIQAVNRRMPGFRLVHSTPVAYQRAVRNAARRRRFTLRVHTGELRGGRYHNLLPGVLSARVDLKLAHDRCETELLRWAEPCSALARSLGLGRDDRAALAHAWRLLLLCQPHDDICGCSIDRVHDDDHNRMARVVEIAAEVRDRALDALASRVARDGRPVLLAFNPHPWPLEQVLELPAARRRGLAGPEGPLPLQRGRGCQLTRVRLPALGYATLAPATALGTSPSEVTVRRAGRSYVLDNALLELRVTADGQLRLKDRRSGLVFSRVAELIDEGDAGDTYDFAPPQRQRVVRGLTRVSRVSILERGPLRVSVELVAALALPTGLTRDRRSRRQQLRRVPVRLRISLCAGSPRVDLTLELENTVEDHRLRLGLKAPFVADGLWAGAPFQVIRRPIAPLVRPHWHQPPAPVHPFADFVAVEGARGGIALLAPGLREAAASADRRATRLAITLLRSVGWLSRDDLSTRKGEAGPCFPVEGAKQLGRIALRLALLPYSGTWLEAQLPRRYAELAAPPRIVKVDARPPAPPLLPAAAGLLALEPASVQLAALLPGPDGSLEARLVNLEPRPVRARLQGQWRGRRLRLDGTPLPGRVNLADLPLRPCEILTLRLEPVLS